MHLSFCKDNDFLTRFLHEKKIKRNATIRFLHYLATVGNNWRSPSFLSVLFACGNLRFVRAGNGAYPPQTLQSVQSAATLQEHRLQPVPIRLKLRLYLFTKKQNVNKPPPYSPQGKFAGDRACYTAKSPLFEARPHH